MRHWVEMGLGGGVLSRLELSRRYPSAREHTYAIVLAKACKSQHYTGTLVEEASKG